MASKSNNMVIQPAGKYRLQSKRRRIDDEEAAGNFPAAKNSEDALEEDTIGPMVNVHREITSSTWDGCKAIRKMRMEGVERVSQRHAQLSTEIAQLKREMKILTKEKNDLEQRNSRLEEKIEAIRNQAALGKAVREATAKLASGDNTDPK
ncbi:hypothetical protein PpBr36_03772 [Pyricularia pennisetigena]|uniref:hypothetical protein n=1 Tax=Pyricularia pennisetigena TaxID=1578925 RepID=UPI001153C03B|nr:hypothetical protein PpBr36_03772 [Pyricularia pennisetigena]TLS30317.1 hypothetical protein PpBr36_03772 [Pyricularia pennisetigena]